MSELTKPQLSDSHDCPLASSKPILQKIITREAHIGEGLTIHRALPHPERRMIGAWCFLDHFGPLNLKESGLSIAPHPHMGLQTLTWTLHGEILHRDSLGSKQVIKPGQVNLMTAGEGISHSEESLPDTMLHGVQLWIALPGNDRFIKPDFAHYVSVPYVLHQNLFVHIIAGEFLGAKSPSKTYSPLVGLELYAQQDTETVLPLQKPFEYGILPLIDDLEIEGETVNLHSMIYLGAGRDALAIKMKKGARALIVGGEPFKEEILIWWNFVGRTKAELLEAIEAWNEHKRFGEVKGYPGQPLIAPPMPEA